MIGDGVRQNKIRMWVPKFIQKKKTKPNKTEFNKMNKNQYISC